MNSSNVLALALIIVSSANNVTLETYISKSFINNKNNVGPKSDPCGIPTLTSSNSESSPLIIVHC